MNEILTDLKSAILSYNAEKARSSADKAIEAGIDPIIVANAAIEAIKEVGDKYGRGEAWLPDLVGTANAMTSAMSRIEEEFKRTGKERESLGTLVIGTVYGDIHSIGKDMVATLATAEGFKVIDLGINVKSEVFMDSIRENKANILAMSALLTTTTREQAKVIRMLEEENMRNKVKVAVGGGAITADFAKSIGADGFEPTAPMAISLFKRFVKKGG